MGTEWKRSTRLGVCQGRRLGGNEANVKELGDTVVKCLRKWALESGSPGFESQFLHVLVSGLWANYVAFLTLISCLENGDNSSTHQLRLSQRMQEEIRMQEETYLVVSPCHSTQHMGSTKKIVELGKEGESPPSRGNSSWKGKRVVPRSLGNCR